MLLKEWRAPSAFRVLEFFTAACTSSVVFGEMRFFA